MLWFLGSEIWSRQVCRRALKSGVCGSVTMQSCRKMSGLIHYCSTNDYILSIFAFSCLNHFHVSVILEVWKLQIFSDQKFHTLSSALSRIWLSAKAPSMLSHLSSISSGWERSSFIGRTREPSGWSHALESYVEKVDRLQTVKSSPD